MTQVTPHSPSPSAPPWAESLSPHRVATELSDIRREIARLKRREAALLSGEPVATLRPGWPMQRLRQDRG
ncbi:hypothetical protein [Stagnihabitans tardus]|uniref:Uncharacterized protein n=1 Tax=Stagnihabitans tardus TaxID=2699202 RepID=A0AAE5BWY7_9RHOB|nr:hypothetical protein [Stagnihabitans tardus]NBZ88728.1 hypothetical protein [Stagnihabitans tardus]